MPFCTLPGYSTGAPLSTIMTSYHGWTVNYVALQPILTDFTLSPILKVQYRIFARFSFRQATGPESCSSFPLLLRTFCKWAGFCGLSRRFMCKNDRPSGAFRHRGTFSLPDGMPQLPDCTVVQTLVWSEKLCHRMQPGGSSEQEKCHFMKYTFHFPAIFWRLCDLKK